MERALREKNYIVENLQCSECASDIEKKIIDLSYVEEVNLDFLSKFLYIRFAPNYSEEKVDEVKNIIRKIEPKVVFKEMVINKKLEEREFSLDNLDCAHCAAEIEEAINKELGSSKANVDFVSKTLYLTDDSLSDEQLKKLVKDVEPEVELKSKTKKVNKEREFSLDNLDCAHCAAEIEEAINKELGSSKANVDFVSKTLYLTDDSLSDDQLKKLVKDVEPEVDLKAKKKSKEKEYILDNLDCAHCAAEIEDALNAKYGPGKANVDFVSKTLYLKDSKVNVEDLNKLIKEVEPDVNVKTKASYKKEKKEVGQEKKVNKDNVFLLISLILFGVSFLSWPGYVTEILLITSYLLVGYKIILISIRNISKGNFLDENFLMTIATIGATAIGEYREAAAVMLFYSVGEYLQDRAVDNSRRSILQLMDIRPDYVNLVTESGIEVLLPEEIEIGSKILVKPGEKIPIDGIIIEGSSYLDTSKLTGESVPELRSVGDRVLSGSINENNSLYIETEKDYEDSTVYKIVELMEKSNKHKSNTENFITKFARYYTPIVVGLALIIGLVVPIVIKEPMTDWIYRSLVFLVASCPCAILISIPLSYFAGIGRGSKEGILIKGSNHLEAFYHVNQMVFDKTGTLTKGVFTVTKIDEANGYAKEDVVKWAAFGESHSNHPISNAIKNYYGKDIDDKSVKEYEEIAGKGVRVLWEEDEILVGNDLLLRDHDVNYEELAGVGTKVYVARNREFVGSLLLADEIKEESYNLVNSLNQEGIDNLIMLTGDKVEIGNYVGEQLHLSKVYSQLLPEDKVNKFKEISRSKEKVTAFVGDGINDAPVLALSDVGISMGNIGSDAAIEASDIVIMNDDISKIATTMRLAKYTRKIVIENIALTFGVKVFVLILGAMGIANMWMAVFADVGVALLAVINSMRLLWSKQIK